MKKSLSLLLIILMCFSLCACGKAGHYEDAMALMDEGNYEEARAIFLELEDYEDSADKMWECEKIIALSSRYNNIDDLAIALVTYFEGTEEDIAILRTNTDIHSFFQQENNGIETYHKLAEKFTVAFTDEYGSDLVQVEELSADYIPQGKLIYEIFNACSSSNWFMGIDTGYEPLGFSGDNCMPTIKEITQDVKGRFKDPSSVTVSNAWFAVVSEIENGVYTMPMEYVIIADIRATNSFGGYIQDTYLLTGNSNGRIELEYKNPLVSFNKVKYNGQEYSLSYVPYH